MCGICGIHRFGDVPIDPVMIDLLILHNQNRGLEAAGIALQQADGSIQVHKEDVTPYEFVASPAYKNFIEENLNDTTVTMLGHTRKVTKGSPRDNKNNHPMWAGETAVIHNGVIHNDDTLFKDWKLERKAETDSDIIRAILDDEGFTPKAVNLLSKCSGNAAIAAISSKYPGKLLLARSGNPIELAATKDHLLFSSEKGPIYKAMRPYKEIYGIIMREMTPINYYMIGMVDHTAWLFSEKPKVEGTRDWSKNWLEWHHEMKIAYNWTPIAYQCHAQFHGNRIKFYDDRPIDVVQCPNPNCNLYIDVPQANLKDLKRFKCGTCKTPLAS